MHLWERECTLQRRHQKLVEVAKQLRAGIITNDFNLNKVASVQDIVVINLNDVANALKVVPDKVTVASLILIECPSTKVPDVSVPSIVGQLVCQLVDPTCTQLFVSFL